MAGHSKAKRRTRKELNNGKVITYGHESTRHIDPYTGSGSALT
jgi:hypothetical protein